MIVRGTMTQIQLVLHAIGWRFGRTAYQGLWDFLRAFVVAGVEGNTSPSEASGLGIGVVDHFAQSLILEQLHETRFRSCRHIWQ